jgi:hypothetical protein
MAKPDIVFESGNCKASVFYNDIDRDGKTVKIPKVSIAKRYIDKNDEWKSTQSYKVNDLPKVLVVIMKPYEFLTRKNNEKDIISE